MTEKLWPGALQLPNSKCAQVIGWKGRAMTSAGGWSLDGTSWS